MTNFSGNRTRQRRRRCESNNLSDQIIIVVYWLNVKCVLIQNIKHDADAFLSKQLDYWLFICKLNLFLISNLLGYFRTFCRWISFDQWKMWCILLAQRPKLYIQCHRIQSMREWKKSYLKLLFKLFQLKLIRLKNQFGGTELKKEEKTMPFINFKIIEIEQQSGIYRHFLSAGH